MSRRQLWLQRKSDNWRLKETHRGFVRWARYKSIPPNPLLHKGRKP